MKLSVSLLEKSVHNVLFMAHKFFPFLEAVRFSLNVYDSAVVQDAIQNGRSDGDVGKDLIPLGEGLVGSKDGGGFLIAPGNQLKKEIRPFNVHRKRADFVDNQHSVLGQDFELIRQTVLKMSFFELLNELVAVDVVGRKAVLCGYKTQSGCEMGFAHTWRAKEDYVFPIFQETHGG